MKTNFATLMDDLKKLIEEKIKRERKIWFWILSYIIKQNIYEHTDFIVEIDQTDNKLYWISIKTGILLRENELK